MNNRTASERVARIYLAQQKKEAALTEKLQSLTEKVVGSVVQDTVSKQVQSTFSSEALNGWKMGKINIKDIVSVVKNKGSDLDLNDPIQKLIYESTLPMSPVDKVEAIGKFNVALSNKDIEGMASALKVEKELISIVLLWYTRDKGISKKGSRNRHPLEWSKAVARVTSTYPMNIIKAAEWITGGRVLEWLVELLPGGTLYGKPLKWAYWAGLVVTRWSWIPVLTKWASMAWAWWSALLSQPGFIMYIVKFFLVKLPAFLGFLLTVKGFYIYVLVFGGIMLFGEYVKNFEDKVGKYKFFNAAKIYLTGMWQILKGVISGALSVPRFIYNEVIEYVQDNLSFLKKFFYGEKNSDALLEEALA